jgi:hypothetical protein
MRSRFTEGQIIGMFDEHEVGPLRCCAAIRVEVHRQSG